jgi:FkbH-like protein
VCSKNNPDDALEVIRNHKHMVLREEHFAAMRINWRSKVDNIKEIAEELNIGLEAMVFIDDNPVERELVRQMLPEVMVLDLPADPSRYRQTLEYSSDFELLALTKEDESRVGQYRAMEQRRALRAAATSLGEYLRSLDLHVQVRCAGPQDVTRIAQMCNRTNQFNLTTRRYQVADIARLMSSGEHLVYALAVTDKFSDHGVTGAAIVVVNGGTWRIDTFLMSCRVMGLGVEDAFIASLARDAEARGVRALQGEYIPTRKNVPCRDFYGRMGFSLLGNTTTCQLWELDIGESKIRVPEWITMVPESPV